MTRDPGMRRLHPIRMAALAALLLALTLTGGAGAAGAHGHPAAGSAELPPDERPAAIAAQSIYQLDSDWRDDHGVAQSIGALAGHPVVLAMVYTSCENACPVLVEDMKRIEQALPPAERGQVTFALFSYDPARDTPAAMAAYRAKRGLGEGHWRLFTSDPDAVLELAAVLGVKFRPDGFGDFAHSNLITVLDTQGVVRHRQVGINQPPAETVAALRALLGG